MVCEMELGTIAEHPAGISGDYDATDAQTSDVGDVLDLTCASSIKPQEMMTYSPVSVAVNANGVGRRCRRGSQEEKTYVCDYKECSYRTKYKNAMKRHIETQHLALVHHICKICLKSFKHQDNLSKHVKIHKKDERCPLCHRVFALKQQLRQHLQNKHNVDPDLHIRNNLKLTGFRSPTKPSLISFTAIEECATQVNQPMNISPKMEDPNMESTHFVAAKQETNTEIEPSDGPVRGSITSRGSTPASSASPSVTPGNPDSSIVPGQFEATEISESIVREAVLQNPNLSLKQVSESENGYPQEFTSDSRAMTQGPLNLSVNKDTNSSDLHCEVSTQDELKKTHYGNDSPMKIFKCSVCEYQTVNKAHIRRHCMSVHTSVKPYYCSVCGQGFTRTEKVKRHIIRTHPGYLSDGKSLKIHTTDGFTLTSDNSLSSESRTPSPRVTSSSDNVEKEIQQIQSYEPVKQQNLIASTKAFQCVQCDFFASDEDQLHEHMQSHSKLQCPYCRFSSCDLEAYMYHLKGCIRHHHAESNLVTCDYCQDEVDSQSELTSHLLSAHGIEVYKCEFCTYSTDNKDCFLYHYDCHLNGQISAHDNIAESVATQLYCCSLCSFQTRYQFIMKNHSGFHTDEAQHCSTSGCSFRTVLDMSMKVHHQLYHSLAFRTHNQEFQSCENHVGKSEMNSYRCGSCFLTFTSLAALRQHLNNCEIGQLEKSVYGRP